MKAAFAPKAAAPAHAAPVAGREAAAALAGAAGRSLCRASILVVSTTPHQHAGSAAPGAWAEQAADRLAGAGYRRGGARQAVIELLAAQPCALSALEIEEALRSSARQVARASVYRVLDELEQLKLVARIEVGQGISRYEALHPHGAHHHHHLVCRGCGRSIEIEAPAVEAWASAIGRTHGFSEMTHTVELYGTCRDCAG